jgi:hypothetical protein
VGPDESEKPNLTRRMRLMRPFAYCIGVGVLVAAAVCCGCDGGDLADRSVPKDAFKNLPASPGMPPGMNIDEMKAKTKANAAAARQKK